MDWQLVQTLGTKALMAGAGALLLYWTISAVKLVLNARGINPVIKQFFTQVASGRIDAARAAEMMHRDLTRALS